LEVWALGEDRFRITAPGHEQIVTGFEEAQRTADALAERLEVEARGTRGTRAASRARGRRALPAWGP